MYLYQKNIGFIKCFEVWNLVNFYLGFCSVQAITASFCNRKNIWIWDGKSLIALPYPIWTNWTLYIFIVLILHRHNRIVSRYKLNRSPPSRYIKFNDSSNASISYFNCGDVKFILIMSSESYFIFSLKVALSFKVCSFFTIFPMISNNAWTLCL